MWTPLSLERMSWHQIRPQIRICRKIHISWFSKISSHRKIAQPWSPPNISNSNKLTNMTRVETSPRSPTCCVASTSKHRRPTNKKVPTSPRRKSPSSNRSPSISLASTKFKRPRQLCRTRMAPVAPLLIRSSLRARSTPRKLPRVSVTTQEANIKLNRTIWCPSSRLWSSRSLTQSPSARRRITWSRLLLRSSTLC